LITSTFYRNNCLYTFSTDCFICTFVRRICYFWFIVQIQTGVTRWEEYCQSYFQAHLDVVDYFWKCAGCYHVSGFRSPGILTCLYQSMHIHVSGRGGGGWHLSCFPRINNSWHVCCLHLKMEFRSCARGRQWVGIIHCYWWTASGYASWGLSLSSV